MSGLILLLTLALCIWAGVWLVRFVGRKVPNPKWKAPVMVGLSLTLLTAPFVDEVIGMYQFEALCKANGIESADVSKARGKRVRINYDYAQEGAVPWQIVPTIEAELQIKDALTGEVLARYKDYRTEGGWLMRYTPLSMGSPQSMLFGGSTCDWTKAEEFIKRYEMTWIKN